MYFSEISYPITGFYKIPLLILEWMTVLIFLEMAGIFWMRLRSGKKHLKNPQEKAFSWVSFGYAMMWIFFIIGDYYVSRASLRLFFRNLGFCFIALAGLILVYIMEKNIFIFFKKYLLSVLYFGFFIILIFISIFFSGFVTYFMFSFIPFLFFFLIFYFRRYRSFSVEKKELSEYWHPIFYLFLGGIILFIGYGLTTDIFIQILNLDIFIRFIGDFLQILSTFFLISFILSIPYLAEIEWKEKIECVLLMDHSGRYIFKRFFKQEEDLIDGSIYTGYLASIKLILEKVMENDKLSVIEKKDKLLLYEPGDYLVGVMICDERLRSLEILLRKFVRRVEFIYGDILKNWDGSLKILRPIEDIADKIFS
ncbi:MAG: hypothetical protein ACOC44_14680 [Promethearchaeia archaeon]